MNKNFPVFILALAACLTLTSCANEEVKVVSTTDSKNVEQVVDAEVIEVKLDDSIINWEGAKIIGGSHFGTLDLSKGEILTKNQELVGGSFTIDMSSLDVRDLDGIPKQNFEDHMGRDDYFDTANFPEAKFEITKAIPSQTTNFTHTIFGNLTIKDITKNISFEANVQGLSSKEVTVIADFNLDRANWEIGHANDQSILDELKDNALRPEFNIKLDIKS